MLHRNLPVIHYIRVIITAAAKADGIPFFKSVLGRHAVPQMPFTGQGTVIPFFCQNVCIDGLPF